MQQLGWLLTKTGAMITAFDIADLFEMQWGHRPPREFNVKGGTGADFAISPSYADFDIAPAPAAQVYGKLGGNYWDKDNYGREYFMPVSLNGVALWFPVITVLDLSREVVETDMVERSGSVKEIISIDDIVINIKGLIISPNNNWPEDEFTQLTKLFALNRSIEINSVITNIVFNSLFGGNKNDKNMVLIKKVPITPKVGVKHVIPYEMNLISDTIFELELA